MKDWIRQVTTLMGMDLRDFVRVKLIITSSVLMPAVMTLAFGLGVAHSDQTIQGLPAFNFIFPGILSVGTMFSSVFCAGYVIILDRQKSFISDLILSPVSYSTYIVARLFATVIKSLAQFILCIVIAIPFFGGSVVFHPILLLMGYLLTSFFFAIVGMILGSFSNVLTFPGIANFILLPSLFFSGVFFPMTNFKQLLIVLQLFPFTTSVDIFRYSLTEFSFMGGAGVGLFVLLFYTICGLFFWIWYFKKRIRIES